MTIRVVCAIVFILFTWCWVYYFQCDLLAMAQHVLSNGLTHYNRVVGAIVITVVLMFFQNLVHKYTRLNKSFYSLTFFPSMLLLGMLTNITPDPEGGINHGFSGWLAILVLIAWGCVSYVSTKLQELDDDANPNILSRSMWVNLLLLVFQINRFNVDGALRTGKKSLECDEPLVMLRMHALARKDALGEQLFEYKVCGSSKSILPTNDSIPTLLLYLVDSIYKFIGAVPAYKMEPMHYLKLVQRKDSVPRKVVTDYLLSGYLIDKDIDNFVRELGKHYSINDSLPKHYREAMVLYTHLRSRPVAVYHNTAAQHVSRQERAEGQDDGRIFWYLLVLLLV